MRRSLALPLLLTLLHAGCSRSSVDGHPQPNLGTKPAEPRTVPAAWGSGAGAEPSPVPRSSPDPPWVEAFRAGRYADAARALDATGDLTSRPELRYARARAAAALGERQRAIELLAGLEARLPVLEGLIRTLRAESELEVGPYADAADFFAARGDPAGLANAALARERNGEFSPANALASRVITELGGKRLRDTETLAREVRARALTKSGAKTRAAADLRWLALEAPLAAGDPDVRLSELAPAHALTKEERLGRALSLGRSGALERALAELDRLGGAPGPALAPARVDRARAFALYTARSDYARASELFTRAAKGPGVDSAECLFYAARSLARAQEDARALAGYRDLRARFARSTWAEQAGYLVARTEYAGGSFAAAATDYDAYLAQYGKRGRYRDDALYERAVAWLALGRNSDAAKVLASLGHDERDERRAARLRHLEAVARAGAGDTTRAAELFQRVARDQPLGFSALAGAERLTQLGSVRPLPLPEQVPVRPPPPVQVVLPAAVELLHGLGLDRDAESELRRFERPLGRRFAPRSDEALCAAYGLLDTAARRHQIAQDRVDAKVLASAPSAATRWQWDCVYPRPYAYAVAEAASASGVPEALLYGVMRQESGFRPDVTSPAGARGLMQLLPGTAERLARDGAEAFRPADLGEPGPSLRLSARYLKKLLDAFGGNVALAAAAYNAGPLAVKRWVENAPGLPVDLFVARIPYPETLDYVERVVGNFARYRYLEQGVAGVPRLSLELPPAPHDVSGLY